MSSNYRLQSVAELSERTISVCLDEMVRRFEDQPAVLDPDRMLTFNDLHRSVNQLAHVIRKRTGTGRDPIVLLMDQRATAVVGVLAILKAGKICVPANPVNNEARFLKAIIGEMKPALVVTCRDHLAMAEKLSDGIPTLDIDDSDDGAGDWDAVPSSLSEDGAIVVYTSGSTGIPKGVLHHPRNILHRAFWYAAQFDIGKTDRTIMLSAPDHISGVVGMLRAMLTGGRLYMWSIRRHGLLELALQIKDQGITILPIVNSVFRRLTDELAPDFVLPSLRFVIIGGESAHADDVQRFRRHCPRSARLINTLGCTELPTYRYFIIDHETELPGNTIPAGHPVNGTDSVIVGDNGIEAKNGEVGEIVVRSPYLAAGYWKRPDETAKRFGFDAEGKPVFHTGDLGVIRADGLLEHVGRRDWFVKILGNRVELGEIEASLRLHPEVLDACVVMQKQSTTDSTLCAYIVARDNCSPAAVDVQAYLRTRLPDYMVPSRVEFLPALPLNRSGKIDRHALATREGNLRREGTVREPPVNDAERLIARICQEVLGLDSIGTNENLFDLGANSLLATMIVTRLNQAFDLALPLALIFDRSTVSALATFISNSRQV